jgi:hypothetical protein
MNFRAGVVMVSSTMLAAAIVVALRRQNNHRCQRRGAAAYGEGSGTPHATAEATGAIERAIHSAVATYDHHEKQRRCDSERTFAVAMCGAIVAALVFGATACQAYFMLGAVQETKRSADAALIQAKATKQTTDLMIAIEKANILINDTHGDIKRGPLFVVLGNAGRLTAKGAHMEVISTSERPGQPTGLRNFQVELGDLAGGRAVGIEIPIVSADDVVAGRSKAYVGVGITFHDGVLGVTTNKFCLHYQLASWVNCAVGRFNDFWSADHQKADDRQ